METPNIPKGSRVLRLTLSHKPFDVMVTGEKTTEYRKPSKWILSRLEGREVTPAGVYDYVLFTNGYGADKPWFLARYDSWEVSGSAIRHLEYSNGLQVAVDIGDILIHLGGVLESGNLKQR